MWQALGMISKHGLTNMPERGSSMDMNQKLALFGDLLDEHNISSTANKDVPLVEKLFLDRFYRIYCHALDNFKAKETMERDRLMQF
ncbi:hypothetical protein PRNP1_011900 [Phytophthora ramorum]